MASGGSKADRKREVARAAAIQFDTEVDAQMPEARCCGDTLPPASPSVGAASVAA